MQRRGTRPQSYMASVSPPCVLDDMCCRILHGLYTGVPLSHHNPYHFFACDISHMSGQAFHLRRAGALAAVTCHASRYPRDTTVIGPVLPRLHVALS
jgi:hypothetical protein